ASPFFKTMSKYKETLSIFAKSLTAQYDVIFKQTGNVGDSREKAVIEYLKKVNADKYGFVKGEVFDETGNSSGEVDIIIYDKLFSTVFQDGSGKILAPVESTYGIIEVKSTLTIEELNKSINKLKKYDALIRKEAQENQVYLIPDVGLKGGTSIQLSRTDNQRINVIFAFENTVKKETLLKIAKQCDLIDLLVVPSDFCYFGRKRQYGWGLENNGQEIKHFLSISHDSVALWTMYLQILLGRSRLIAVDLQNPFIELIRSNQIQLF
ncbi:MAG: DUF6602 domain-containing protein, partial [bacterium]